LRATFVRQFHREGNFSQNRLDVRKNFRYMRGAQKTIP